MPLPDHLAGLLDPAAYPHPVATVRLIETHISWVLIAGDYAYKLKKPLDLGFLDYSSLDKRRFYCEEEIRLNGRLAPDTYLGVVAVTGTRAAPHIGGEGAVLEWAVRMRAFPPDATLDQEPEVAPEQIDAVIQQLARFHLWIGPAGGDYGSPVAVMQPVRENFRQIRELSGPSTLLDALEAWSEAEGACLQDHFARRKAAGFVRECHGDLHLANIAWVQGRPLIFDGIEFNPGLRCIDVVSELAFLCMDLIARGHAALAWRALNRWLEQTGDYDGLAAWRFYLVYRALVRAKVAAIRASQGVPAAKAEAQSYLELAQRLCQRGRPALVLMHGYSGSGKTWLAQRLLEAMGAIRLRSDVERKRLAGLATDAQSGSGVGTGLYTEAMTRKTFEHLRRLAVELLGLGFPVIVDATFLRCQARAPFLALAQARHCPCRIVHLEADEALLRSRIGRRAERESDASEATAEVLERQLAHHDPLAPTELAITHSFDIEQSATWPAAIQALAAELTLGTSG